MLHRHGAMSCWDYAAAAPYVQIEMTRLRRRRARIARMRFPVATSSSGDRARRACWSRRGAVQQPCSDRAGRRDGGRTSIRPSIATSRTSSAVRRVAPRRSSTYRAGLVFQLKEAVGVETIREREDSFTRRRHASMGRRTPRPRSSEATILPRLSIVSFVVVTRPGTCTTTSWWRCSTICSGSRRVAAARARDTGTGCSGSTWNLTRVRTRNRARGCEGIKPGGCA